MRHCLCIDHAADAVVPFVQEAVLSLFLGLSTLSFNVEVEQFRSLESCGTKGAAEAECNVNSLQCATRLASDLGHVFVFSARIIEQHILVGFVTDHARL